MTAVRIPRHDRVAVLAGDERALLAALIAHLSAWFRLAGRSPLHPMNAAHLASLEGTAKAGLLAAAMDVRALLAQSPQGRQALRDFGFQPFLEHVEGE